MESSNDLHPTFLSPFSDNQARAYEVDYQVPLEYQMGIQIRDKLPQVNFNTLNEDTLFFLFYLFGNDYVQLSAATELYRRDWRYHKDERLWLTRIKNIMPDHKYDMYETGVYCVFDVQLWRKTHKSMRIDYDKLDGKHRFSARASSSSSSLFSRSSRSSIETAATARLSDVEVQSATVVGTILRSCVLVQYQRVEIVAQMNAHIYI